MIGIGNAARRKSVAQLIELFVRPMAEKVLLEKQLAVAFLLKSHAASIGTHCQIRVPEHASIKQIRKAGNAVSHGRYSWTIATYQ